MPEQWSNSQKKHASMIVKLANKKRLDPHAYVALAWHESSLNPSAVSNTGDVGIFQINYRWHHEALGFRSYKEFKREMVEPKINTLYAFAVMADLSWKTSCRRNNIFACYNGGAGWRASKNIDKIVKYRNEVVRKRDYLRRRFPIWSRMK
jgi:soluble lytic murein transglycosylase-like protein